MFHKNRHHPFKPSRCRPSCLPFNGGYICNDGGGGGEPSSWWSSCVSTLGEGIAAGVAAGALTVGASRFLRRRRAAAAPPSPLPATPKPPVTVASPAVASLVQRFGITPAQAVQILNTPAFVQSLLDFRPVNMSGTGSKHVTAAGSEAGTAVQVDGGAPATAAAAASKRQTVADTVVYPFVFDKILGRSAGLGSIPVADASNLAEFIRCANTDNVLSGNAAINAVYHSDSNRKFVDLHGRWTRLVMMG